MVWDILSHCYDFFENAYNGKCYKGIAEKITEYVTEDDVVVAANVIHLLDEPEKAISELKRVCKPNGKIILPTYVNNEKKNSTVAKIETYLCQLQQVGAFDKIAGIILGTFTEMEKEKCIPNVETLVKRVVEKDVPIAMTRDIGHGTDSKGIIIGQELCIEE